MTVLSRAWRYGLAMISCAVALALSIPLDAPSSCFFLAIIVSSLYGGKGPGVLSVLLSSVAFDYFFLPPKYNFWIQSASYPRFAAFLVPGLLITVVIEAKRRVEESRGQIDAQYRQVSADALAQALKSEARMRLIIDSIPVPAWSSRADGSADFINQRWLDYTGLPMEEALGWGWKVVCHPEDLDRTMEYWRLVLSTHEERELEARLRRFDGTYRWFLFRVNPLRDELGNVVQWYGTCIDIEDRKMTADALRASELKFRLIVHSIPGLVATMTSQGDLELVNQPVLDYTGLTFDALKDWWATRLLPEEELPGVAAKWKQSVETGCEYNVEHHMRGADGSYRWFHVRALPLRDNQGSVVRWYCVLTDIEDHKRTEEALRAREQQLRLMVDSIPALVTTMTPAGETEMVNQQLLAYTGQTAEDLTNWHEKIHPEDRRRVSECWRRSVENGTPYEAEERIQRADGVYRWFHSRGLPMRDTEGHIVRWSLLLTDVEDRKRAEESVRASEFNFRLMVHSIPGLLFTNTVAGEVEVVNQPLLNYTGKSLEELKNWPAMVHPAELPAVVSLWAHSVETGRPFDVDLRIRRADGVYRWFHARGLPLRDNDGRIVRWYNLLTDIEDRINAEDALRARERELSLIIETIPALVWCAAPGGELTYVNRRVLDYTGASPEDMARDGWTHYLYPDDFEPTLRAWSHAVATGSHYEVQYRLRRSDGAYRWFHVLGQGLLDSEGGLTRWYGLLIDIDDRKSMEEALRTTQTRLSRATQTATVGELSASIAHEINQPLAAVVTNGHACLRWLTADTPNLGKAREAAERIVRDGKEAGEVVRRIRALFRRATLEKVPLDLNDVIGEVLGLLGAEATKRSVSVETNLETTLPPVVADRVQLQQLILNLLLNGLDAMDGLSGRPRKLFIRSRQHCEDTALVEIQDSGVGLKDPDKVFEAFFTTKENGMGMGLTICRSIVEAHDGRLWASPAEGAGTVFHFALPLKSGATA
jgi:PAS domain S-box-containing protein